MGKSSKPSSSCQKHSQNPHCPSEPFKPIPRPDQKPRTTKFLSPENTRMEGPLTWKSSQPPPPPPPLPSCWCCCCSTGASLLANRPEFPPLSSAENPFIATPHTCCFPRLSLSLSFSFPLTEKILQFCKPLFFGSSSREEEEWQWQQLCWMAAEASMTHGGVGWSLKRRMDGWCNHSLTHSRNNISHFLSHHCRHKTNLSMQSITIASLTLPNLTSCFLPCAINHLHLFRP